ncbi:hypothetical protein GQ55_2G037300 [Panicum hallii var. hallii]|uniref:Uncharacterized protein n=1 Tax=Panicum hallii var. hallii TaxID=1504633 RepID=A0A2T7EL46_9POAL|nr:hypothetical protein GQ55_2G037300 [Panicum hallii var. hallii]
METMRSNTSMLEMQAAASPSSPNQRLQTVPALAAVLCIARHRSSAATDLTWWCHRYAGDEPTGVPRRCGGQVRPIHKVEGDGERTTRAAVVRAAPETHPVVGSTETREEETGESPTAECRNWAAEAGPRSPGPHPSMASPSLAAAATGPASCLLDAIPLASRVPAAAAPRKRPVHLIDTRPHPASPTPPLLSSTAADAGAGAAAAASGPVEASSPPRHPPAPRLPTPSLLSSTGAGSGPAQAWRKRRRGRDRGREAQPMRTPGACRRRRPLLLGRRRRRRSVCLTCGAHLSGRRKVNVPAETSAFFK